MRMPLSEFLSSGDPKFVIVLVVFLITGIIFFAKKRTHKEVQDAYNIKLNKLVSWSLMVSCFSLLVGLLHSFYFIAQSKGIAAPLLFGGLANVLVTPILGIVIAMVIKLLATPLKTKS